MTEIAVGVGRDVGLDRARTTTLRCDALQTDIRQGAKALILSSSEKLVVKNP